jgi:hypothetical protein
MISDTQLQLSAPLFLYALLIVNASPEALRPGGFEFPVPGVTSISEYCRLNVNSSEDSKRRRINAITVAKIVASFFVKAEVVSPAGLCPPDPFTSRLDKKPRWIAFLSSLDPRKAIETLASTVSDSFFDAVTIVEQEYNAGLRKAASAFEETAECARAIRGLQLPPKSLARSIEFLKWPRLPPPVLTDRGAPTPLPRFYCTSVYALDRDTQPVRSCSSCSVDMASSYRWWCLNCH